MTVMLFVHGTGVREARCLHFAQEIAKGMRTAAPELDVKIDYCYWGDLGARHLAEMSSVPRRGAATPAEEADYKAVRSWEQVYGDPLAEFEPVLSIDPLAQFGSAAGSSPGRPGQGRTWQEVRIRAGRLSADSAIQLKLAEWFDQDPLALDDFAAAANRIVSSSRVDECLSPLGELGGQQAAMLARAIVAAFQVQVRVRTAGGAPGDVDGAAAGELDLLPLSAQQRDELARLVTASLGLQDLSMLGTAARASFKPVMWAAAPWLRRYRAEATDAIGPTAGDILLYQSRGAAIRDRLRQTIAGYAEPVVLIGHSLGGIIAVDLLVESGQVAAQVPMLVTAGSQAPYLYEINALPNLRFGERLPAHFPERWVNFWDPRDLLSYLAEGVFAQRGGQDAGKRIEDVRINTREPFHWSHSAYFKQSALFEQLALEVGAVAADGAR